MLFYIVFHMYVNSACPLILTYYYICFANTHVYRLTFFLRCLRTDRSGQILLHWVLAQMLLNVFFVLATVPHSLYPNVADGVALVALFTV